MSADALVSIRVAERLLECVDSLLKELVDPLVRIDGCLVIGLADLSADPGQALFEYCDLMLVLVVLSGD